MIEKTQGIVLHNLKYGDTSLISHLYTRDFGRRSFLIKGARSKKSKLKANLFQVLNILQLEFYLKENQDLLLVKEVSRSVSLNNFPYDIRKSSQALFIAEVLGRCLVEQVPDREMFGFLEKSLEYFDLMETDSANFHLAFFMKLTRYLGILPAFNEKEEINFLDMLEGEFSKNTPQHIQYVDSDNARLLFQLFRQSFEEGTELSLSRSKRNNLLEDIMRFYTTNGYKTDNLKSLVVLKELFS